MKKLILAICVLAAGTLLHSQTIQLPGIGNNTVSIHTSQLNASTQLTFSNAEYNVVGFTVTFATNTNPAYTATSTDNHFTSDMLANIGQINGSDVNVTVTLQPANNVGEHAPWQKNYVLQLGD